MYKKRFFWHLFLVFFLLIAEKSYADAEKPRETLTQAIKQGDLPKVQSIIDSKIVGIEEVPERDYKGITPLVEAASCGQFAIIKYLIEKGASVEGLSKQKSTPLTKLIEEGSSKLSCQQLIEIVRFLIDSGADVNSKGENGYTPLMSTCKHTRCIDLMEMLIDLGALIDFQSYDGDTALFLSIRNTNVKAFRLLVKRNANTSINCKGLSPLGVAASEGDIVMARLIIDELKADVNKYDEIGGTPIFWAALFGHSSMISFLAEKGANINAKTLKEIDVEKKPKDRWITIKKTYVTFPKNCTPLTFAKWSESTPAINLICDLGGIEFKQFELKEWTSW